MVSKLNNSKVGLKKKVCVIVWCHWWKPTVRIKIKFYLKVIARLNQGTSLSLMIVPIMQFSKWPREMSWLLETTVKNWGRWPFCCISSYLKLLLQMCLFPLISILTHVCTDTYLLFSAVVVETKGWCSYCSFFLSVPLV